MNLIKNTEKSDNQLSEVLYLSRNNLLAFAKFIRPNTKIAKHHRIICNFLHKLIETNHPNRIDKGSISLPPRHGKSYIVSEALPAFLVGNCPNSELILSTYGNSLSGLFAATVIKLIRSERFQILFPETKLLTNSDFGMQWGVTSGARVKFTSVQSGIAGFGAGTTDMTSKFRPGFICDDLLENREAAQSPKVIKKLHGWLTNDALTRQLPNSFFLSMGTRWTANDATGFLNRIQPGQWMNLNFEALVKNTENDPLQRKLGEAIWEEWISREKLLEIRSSMSEEDWNSLYMGKPSVESGNIVSKDLVKSVRTYDLFEPNPILFLNIRFDSDSNLVTYLTWKVSKNQITLHKVNQNRNKLDEIYEELKYFLHNNKIKFISIDGKQNEVLGEMIINSKEIGKKPKIFYNKIEYKARFVAEIINTYLEQKRILIENDPLKTIFDELITYPNGINTELINGFLSSIDTLVTNKYIYLKKETQTKFGTNSGFKSDKYVRKNYGKVSV